MREAFLRFLGLGTDLALAYFVFSYLTTFNWFNDLLLSLGNQFQKISFLKEKSQLFSTLFFVYFLGTGVRFWTTLIFKISFGQFILGLRGKGMMREIIMDDFPIQHVPLGTPWLVRLGGAARVCLELLLGPFVIFDLPVLLKKPTLKEKITISEVYDSNSRFPYIGALIFLPTILFLSLASPLLQNLTIIDGVVSHFNRRPPPLDLENLGAFKNSHFPSNRFHFSSYSSLWGSRFILLPSFEIEKKGNKIITSPFIEVFDREQNVFGTLKKTRSLALLKLLKFGGEGNPLFSRQFPNLSKAIEKPGPFLRRSYKSSYGKKTLFTEKEKIEIEHLVEDSFQIGIDTLLNHISQNGPFIRGNIVLRNKMLSLLYPGVPPEVDFVTLGNQKFIRFQQSIQRFPQRPIDHLETIIPIETNNASVMEISFPKTKAGSQALGDFKKAFFRVIDWYLDFKNVFIFPLNIENMKPTHIVDHYISGKLPPKERAVLETYILNFYDGLVKESKNYAFPGYKKKLVRDVVRLIDVGKMVNQKSKGYYSKEFFEGLEVLVSKI